MVILLSSSPLMRNEFSLALKMVWLSSLVHFYTNQTGIEVDEDDNMILGY